MEKTLSALTEETRSLNSIFQPLFYRLRNPDDRKQFEELLKKPGLMVFDEILAQVEELVKSRTPRKVYQKGELRDAAINFIGKESSANIGVWVYFPWAHRVVHILDEKEFIEVRTNRNQYKITPREKEVLSQKKIGVIGLSVGQSIALTISMERICGEIRLADFDKLELSNLNRIRTGIHNMEVSKVISVAREIAEIDPFLKVTCFTEGLSEANMDDFFLKEGKLDACIEVCDGLDIKILSRYKAKELGVPVVMTSSDRGTTDVERYDLNPDLPILHGLLNHLDLTKLKEAKTNEEKVPYLLPMLGLDTTSQRLRSSMLEIEQTITTWPQLASGVVLGGSICTDVCRRIFLNQFKNSGRYIVDIEEIIDDRKDNTGKDLNLAEKSKESFKFDSVQDRDLNLNESELIELSEGVLKDLITAATQAPSGGNIQPWKWVYRSGRLYLYLDSDRAGYLLDYGNKSSLVALGAATENLVLKSHQLGLEVSVNPFPDKNNPCLAVVFIFTSNKKNTTESHEWDFLGEYINKRKTIRGMGMSNSIEESIKEKLCKIIDSEKGAKLYLVEKESEIKGLSEILGKVDRLRILDERGHSDFVNEIRWNKEEANQKKDGIEISALELTPSEYAGFYVSRNWEVVRNVKIWGGGKAFEKYSRRIVPASSAIGLLTMPSNSDIDFFSGGRLMEKIWLFLTMHNICLHPHTASIFLFLRMNSKNHGGLNKDTLKELSLIREKFLNFFPDLSKGDGEIFLFRLFKSDSKGRISLRRNLEDVFLIQ